MLTVRLGWNRDEARCVYNGMRANSRWAVVAVAAVMATTACIDESESSSAPEQDVTSVAKSELATASKWARVSVGAETKRKAHLGLVTRGLCPFVIDDFGTRNANEVVVYGHENAARCDAKSRKWVVTEQFDPAQHPGMFSGSTTATLVGSEPAYELIAKYQTGIID